METQKFVCSDKKINCSNWTCR